MLIKLLKNCCRKLVDLGIFWVCPNFDTLIIFWQKIHGIDFIDLIEYPKKHKFLLVARWGVPPSGRKTMNFTLKLAFLAVV